MEIRKVQVIILALGQNPRVLLFKTNKKRGHFWQNVTGSVDRGEKIEDGAKRELKEESGFKNFLWVKNLERSFHYKKNDKGFIEYLFVAGVDEVFEPIIDPKEHEDFKWISINDITKESYEFESNYLAFIYACKHLELDSSSR